MKKFDQKYLDLVAEKDVKLASRRGAFEKEYLESLVRGAQEAVKLYSNRNKTNREKMVVRAFLRCAGIDFQETDLVIGPEEPVDITFRSEAYFQIKDMIGDRKPGLAAKNRLKRYQSARSIRDLMEPGKSPQSLPFIELTKDVARNLASYSVKYGAKGCAKLDALVHIALEDHHLFPLSAALDPSVVSELDRQGWRSVSLVFLPFSAVFFAKPDCPEFLRERIGQILDRWPNPDGWFDP